MTQLPHPAAEISEAYSIVAHSDNLLDNAASTGSLPFSASLPYSLNDVS